MKKGIISVPLYIISAGIISCFIGLVFGYIIFDGKIIRITECTNETEVKEIVEVKEIITKETKEIANWGEWKCEKIGAYRDLLQPTGVWGFINLRCHKLEQTIEDYCLENPTHCDKQ